MRRIVSGLRISDRGGAAAEYALLAALIAVVIVGAVSTFGLNVEALFSNDGLLNALSS